MTGGQGLSWSGLLIRAPRRLRRVRQAKALLCAADDVSNAETAHRCASTPKSVRRWRSRFAAEGSAAAVASARAWPSFPIRATSVPLRGDLHLSRNKPISIRDFRTAALQCPGMAGR
ncbi:MAG: helix-turn-helix domain-containing protein [Candidatus Dormiibacterota bacterium]